MSNFSKWERVAAASYFVWFFLHLGLFFYSDESLDNSFFWPFCPGDKALASTYDVTEFIVYVGSPLVLFIAYKIVYGRNDDGESSYTHKRHATSSFFTAFLDEKIKVEELTQKINKLENKFVDYTYLDQLKADREKAGSHNVNDWLDRAEIKKKYKEFEG